MRPVWSGRCSPSTRACSRAGGSVRFRPLVQALRGLAHLAYYGEDEAALALGYDADAVLARARA
jgi:hypothetical protein